MRSWMISYSLGLMTCVAITDYGSRLLFVIALAVAIVVALGLCQLHLWRLISLGPLAKSLLTLRPRLLAFAVGALWAFGVLDGQWQSRLPVTYGKSEWQVTGVVTELATLERGLRFNLEVESASLVKRWPLGSAHEEAFRQGFSQCRTMANIVSHPWLNALSHFCRSRTLDRSFELSRLRLSWYPPRGDDQQAKAAFIQQSQQLKEGAVVSLTARLKPPHGLYNPNAFDYQGWLWQKGVSATGYIRQVAHIKPAPQCGLGCFRARLTQALSQRYHQGGQAEQVNGLLHALVVGEGRYIPDVARQLLVDTGTVHIAVISGMHIGFAASLGFLLARGLAMLSIATGRFVVFQRAGCASLMAVSFALAYFLISGMGLPAQRALVMVVCFCVCAWRGWQIDLATRFFCALALVLTLSPLAVYSPGFWLSFLAVAALLSCWYRRGGWAILWVQLRMSWLLMPLSLLFFAQVPWLSVLVNLWAVPYVALVLLAFMLDVLLALIGVDFILPWLVWLISMFWWGLSLFAPPFEWGSAQLNFLPLPLLSAGALWLLVAVVIYGCLPTGFPFRRILVTLAMGLMGLAALLPLFNERNPIAGVVQNSEKLPEIWVLDVGQGLSVYMTDQQSHLLFDAGPRSLSGFVALESALSPMLKQKGVYHLDGLIVSHNDLDHAGGVEWLDSAVSIKRVWLGEVATEPVRRRYLPDSLLKNANACREQRWHWPNVSFSFLTPTEASGRVTGKLPEPSFGQRPKSLSANDQSCVLHVQVGECGVLIPGDISARQERALLELWQTPQGQWPEQYSVDVLIAAHHGSQTSSSLRFLHTLSPKAVIYSAGYLNRFNHPSTQVMERVNALGMASYHTAIEGAIRIRPQKDEGCEIKGYRDLSPKPWHGG